MSILQNFYAAPLLPLHHDGSLRCEAISGYAEHLIANSITGVFINGTTGEGLSLTGEERQTVAESWVRASAGRLHVIVNVAHCSLSESQELAAHAQEIGANGISTVGPLYYPVSDVNDFVSYCAACASAASKIEFYYYHIPTLSRTTLRAASILQAARDRIPTLRGVKFTSSDFLDLSDLCEEAGDDYVVFSGFDELLLPAMTYPIDGIIGSTYNFAAPLYKKAINSFEQGRISQAERFHRSAVKMIKVIANYGVLPSAKAILKRQGHDMGPLRQPLKALTTQKQDALFRDLKEAGFEASVEFVRRLQ